MATFTPRRSIQEYEESQNAPWVVENEEKRFVDIMTNLSVKDKDLTVPPGSPAAGDMYIVGASATGAWATHDDEIAYFVSGGWVFVTPILGDSCYVEDEDQVYRYSGSAWVLELHNFVLQCYTFAGNPLAAGTYYIGGFYKAAAASAALTQASTTQVFGTANSSYAAHAFIVASAAGSSNKTTGAVEIEVSGTSIDDSGTRTASDTEVVVADIEALTANQYAETTKKWIGQITYTLQNNGSGDATTFSATFNYGLAKYEDVGNRDFVLLQAEAVGLASASDSGFGLRVLKHSATGWTYHATAFVPGGTVIVNIATDHSTEDQLVSGDPFAYKRANLNTSIIGSASEGIIVEVKTGAADAIQFMNFTIGGLL